MKKLNPIAEQSKQWLTQSLFRLMEKQIYSEITISKISENLFLHTAMRELYQIFRSGYWIFDTTYYSSLFYLLAGTYRLLDSIDQ